MKSVCPILAFLLLLPPAQGVINFGYDNNSPVTTSDPGNGAPWEAVARVANWDGVSASSPSGTAMHLGDGYMLTADHVKNRSHISFDGSTWYARDTSFTPVQVTPGVDLKVFKLTSSPVVPSVQLYDGVLEQVAASTMIGWGRGRDPSTPVNTDSVPHGNNSTIDKRWGENVFQGITVGDYTVDGSEYFSELVRIILGSETGTPPGLGATEAGLAIYDSGSGLFQEIGGTWFLIGLAVLAGNPSVFGDDFVESEAGENFYVRISPYEDDILAAIPEPAAFALPVALASLLLALRRRRRKAD